MRRNKDRHFYGMGGVHITYTPIGRDKVKPSNGGVVTFINPAMRDVFLRMRAAEEAKYLK